MYSRILIATDGSELAQRGVDQGLALAKALGSSVVLLTASEPWVPMGVDATGIAITEYALADEFEKVAKTQGEQILEAAQKAATAQGITAESVYVNGRYPADAIVETAAARNAELIVMASHGRRGLERVILGSQALQVLTHSPIPVLIVR